MKSKILKYFFLFPMIMIAITTNVNAESKYLYDVLKTEAESGGLAKEYTGEHHDSFTEEPSKKIYHWYADNDSEGNQIREKNNVLFANYCWQIIRTTDTGGVKLIYNGIEGNGQCNNSEENTAIKSSYYSYNYNSVAYIGYMYNPDTLIKSSFNSTYTGVIFGKSIEYSNGNYHLVDTSNTLDNYHHYTCNNTSGICSKVRYHFVSNYYIELESGKTIEIALSDMTRSDNINKTDSNIKIEIDNWFERNMQEYSNKIEDTIFCNSRRIKSLGGWNPDGGNLSEMLIFNDLDEKSLNCSNYTDQFSINNKKAKLKYPVGLITSQEMALLNNNEIRSTGDSYWLGTPSQIYVSDSSNTVVIYNGALNDSDLSGIQGIRPVISLKQNTLYSSGDGSKNNPYIIDLTNYYKIAIEEESKKGHIDFEIEDINSLPEGTEIRFKIVPNRGYMLKDLKIIDEENNNVNYTTNDNINFKFTMPDTDITIIPLYSLKETSDRITNPKTGNTKIILIAILFLIVSITYFIVRKKKKFSSI